MYSFKTLKYSYIRGYLKNNLNIKVNKDILEKELLDLSSSDILELEDLGKKNQLKLYYFKEKEILPRVNIVLGFLRNVCPENILDVGSGRGVFLFPLLKEFPSVKVTSIDLLERRVELLKYIKDGGVNNLNVFKDDICTFKALDNSYEVVTLLEVLEHIPNVFEAIKNAVRISKRFIVVTVPSKEDNNPEHIHLLTKEKLTNMFNSCGVKNLKFSGVNGHLFLIARKSDEND